MILKGKNVFITGCNRGIGKEILHLFAQEGANIFAHTRCKDDIYEQELRELEDKYKVKIVPIYFDLADTITMKKAVMKLIQDKYTIDVLINNAGVAHGGLFQMTSVKNIKSVFEINLFAIMELTQIVLRAMTKKRSGSIINISSISGIELSKGNCAYGVSKAALIAFTTTLSKEVAVEGIRVNAIAPGLTDTDMAKQMNKNAADIMICNTALNRLARPREIAEVALFLASDKSSFITGQVLRVDGGT